MREKLQRRGGLLRLDGMSWTGVGVLLASVLVIGLTIRQRWYLTDREMMVLFGAVFVAGLAADVAWNWLGRRRPLVGRAVIQPLLFLLSVLSMLWVLFGTWAGLYLSYFMAGNLVPFDDACVWVHGAKSLLATGELNQMSSNRPFGICMFATLLAVTNHDYQPALILLVGFAGVATFFAAREIWLAGGIAAAVLFIALSTFLMAPWLPLFMTETPGYTLACLGFAYLLGGFRRDSFQSCLAGFGLLTLGMLTRPGAVAVIPLLALYLLYRFSGPVWEALFRTAALALVCGAVAGLSSLMLKTVGAEGAISQGNAYYAFYGIASGGKRWDYVLEEHPEIYDNPDAAGRLKHVRSLFREKFAADPAGFFSNVFRLVGAGTMRFPEVLFPQFPHFRSIPPAVPGGLALLAFLLLILPAFRRRGPWGFLVPCAVGILISFPIIPDEDGLRYLSASYALSAGLAACAVGLFTVRIRRAFRGPGEGLALCGEKDKEAFLPGRVRAFGFAMDAQAGFSSLMIAVISFVPVGLSLGSGSPPLAASSMTEDGKFWREVVFYHNPHSGVLIGREDRFGSVLQASAKSIVESKGLGLHREQVSQMRLGDYFCDAYGIWKSPLYLVFDEIPRREGQRPGYIKATVRSLSKIQYYWPILYRVEEFEFLEP